jgi:hypothetical protein
MKKSLKSLLKKMQENNFGGQNDGFTVLRNIRGGKLPDSNSTGTCNNEYSCSGSNTSTCNNSGDCTKSSNSGTCTNSTNCYY